MSAAHHGGAASARPALLADDARAGDDDAVDRYTVRSVARAMRLINIVADGPQQGLTLSDLARALGASKSTTLALARTLTSAGVLRDSRPGPRYNLGTALIRLGDITRSQLPLGDICSAYTSAWSTVLSIPFTKSHLPLGVPIPSTETPPAELPNGKRVLWA